MSEQYGEALIKLEKLIETVSCTQRDIQRWLLELNLEQKLSFTEDSRIDTQILYGEKVEVVEEQDGRSYVICLEQPSKQNPKDIQDLFRRVN